MPSFRPALTLADWDEILGLGGLAQQLQAGLRSPADGLALLAQRRPVYPNVALDYIRPLDAMEALCARVQLAVEEQNIDLDALNDALTEADLPRFDYDWRRLLRADERDAVQSLQRRLQDAAEEAERSAEEAEDLAHELEEQERALEDEAIEAEDQQEALEARRDAVARGDDPGPAPSDDGDDGDGDDD